MDGERLMVETFFRELDANAPMSVERIEQAINELGKLDRLIGQDETNKEKGGLRAFLAKRTKSTQRRSKFVAIFQGLWERNLSQIHATPRP